MGALLSKLLSAFHSKHLEVVLVGLNNRSAPQQGGSPRGAPPPRGLLTRLRQWEDDTIEHTLRRDPDGDVPHSGPLSQCAGPCMLPWVATPAASAHPSSQMVKKGNVNMKCWDIGGQSAYRSEWGRYTRGCDVILLCARLAARHRAPRRRAHPVRPCSCCAAWWTRATSRALRRRARSCIACWRTGAQAARCCCCCRRCCGTHAHALTYTTALEMLTRPAPRCDPAAASWQPRRCWLLPTRSMWSRTWRRRRSSRASTSTTLWTTRGW